MPDNELPELTVEDLHLEKLSEVTAVVYGAVLSYTFFLVMQAAGQLFTCPPSARSAILARLATLLLISDYMVADFIEARVLTHAVPYEGKGRFTLDLVISMLFLGACEAANQASRAVLIALGFAFLFGGWWAVYLRIEGRDKYRWTYPACVAGTHVAAGVAAITAYLLTDTPFGATFAIRFWLGYVLWLFAVAGVKELFDVPEPTGFNLMPVSIVAYTAMRTARSVRGWWMKLGAKK